MGQRASLAVRTGGQLSIYYNHWAATQLDIELFWGPQQAREYIQRCQPSPHWLVTNWCEGAALLDEDAGRLIWFGGEDILCDPLLLSVHLALMQCNWTGWEVLWAHHGVLDIARYLGLPLEEVVGEPFRRPAFSGIRYTRSEDPWCRTALFDGRWHSLEHDVGELLRAGPGWISQLRATVPLFGKESPEGVVGLDPIHRTLTYCYPTDTDPRALHLQERWPGWQLHHSREDSLALLLDEGCEWRAAPEADWVRSILKRVGQGEPRSRSRMLSLYWASPPPAGFARGRRSRGSST